MSLANGSGVHGEHRKPAMASEVYPLEESGSSESSESPNGTVNGDKPDWLDLSEDSQTLLENLDRDGTDNLVPIDERRTTQSCPQRSQISNAVGQELDGGLDSNKENHQHNQIMQESKDQKEDKSRVLKLTPAQILKLTSESLPPFAPAVAERTFPKPDDGAHNSSQEDERSYHTSRLSNAKRRPGHDPDSIRTPVRGDRVQDTGHQSARSDISTLTEGNEDSPSERRSSQAAPKTSSNHKNSSLKSITTQNTMTSSRRNSKSMPKPLNLDEKGAGTKSTELGKQMPSPMPESIPIPPYSIPTYLQLELSTHEPSPQYIHHSFANDSPYESCKVKMERLQNFLRVTGQLESVLWFGFFACADAWLSCFTILPLRFWKAIGMAMRSGASNMIAELRFLGHSLYYGPGRLWRRRRASSAASPSRSGSVNGISSKPKETPVHSPSSKSPQFSFPAKSENPMSDRTEAERSRGRGNSRKSKHQRARSTPSTLEEANKADMMKGFLIMCSCFFLMFFDASRMYHGIRGQAAIKLYVIYNVLEVCDRLLSAIGQDVLECLFSKEALERNPDGRSKVMRPLLLFPLALVYNLLHSSALFFQVITLNVAVNSYSNALLTLLMSNQFVEIKSTVFKKFEKENLFQLTCADVVERFQLFHMLLIIMLRNLIETGGFTVDSSSPDDPTLPLTASLYPKAFTIFPTWAGLLSQPFLLVLGSEMLVDSLKHCYITKFNNTKPVIYGRFLDVLAKDYYTNAFAEQNLTRRLGLPVIPLCCLFMRPLFQACYRLVTISFPPLIASTATSLSVDSTANRFSTLAWVQHLDHFVRRALTSSTFGFAASQPRSLLQPSTWFRLPQSINDIVALSMMLIGAAVAFFCLLVAKFALGMLLLSYARGRYAGMKDREAEQVLAEGKRVGGWGVVEVDEDKKRWIYMDDKEGEQKAKEREEKAKAMREDVEWDLGSIRRYSMAGKRIW